MVEIREKDTIDGRYYLKELIANNPSSVVFKAEDRFFNEKEIAIKIFKDESLILRFKREFLILKKINHENVLRVFDFGLDRKSHLYYFTSEYLASHQEILSDKIYDEAIIWNIILQLLQGLKAIHTEGLIHFDITPANIIISKDLKNVKILDLGLASSSTDINSVRGTLFYISPELLFDREFDSRVDLYSLGITLYKIISNQLPYTFDFVEDYLKKLEETTPTPLKTNAPWISDDLDNFVSKLINPNKEKRFLSAKESVDFLSSFLKTQSRDDYIEIKDIPFFGRDEELRIINTHMENGLFQQNSPFIFMISGEEGVGKKRFLSEIKSTFELSDAICFEGDFSESSALKKLENWLFFNQSEGKGIINYEDRLLKGLLCLSKKLKVVIFAYNLHLASSEDVGILKYLIRAIRIEKRKKAKPPYFFITYDAEYNLIEDLEDEACDDLFLLNLTPLAQEKYKNQLSNILGYKIDDKDCEMIFNYTRGNPLILNELWEYLKKEKRIITKDDSISFNLENIKTPNKIVEFIRNRVNILPANEKNIVETLTVYGESIDLHMLENILQRVGLDSESARYSFSESIIGLSVKYDRLGTASRCLDGEQIGKSLKALFEKRMILRKFESGAVRIKIFNDIIKKTSEENIQEDVKNKINYEIGKILSAHADIDVETKIKAGIHFLNCSKFENAIKILLSAISELKGLNRILRALSVIEQLYEKREHFVGIDYYAIGKEYAELKKANGEYESGLNELLVLYEKFHEKRIELNQLIANCMLSLRNYSMVYQYIDEGFEISRDKGRTQQIVEYCVLKSQAQNGELKFTESIETATKAIEIDSELNEKERNPNLYNVIGLSYFYTGDYDLSEKYFHVGLNICDMTLEQRYSKIMVLNNLGMLYFKRENYNNALTSYSRAITIAKDLQDKFRIAVINKNIGTIHQKRMDFESAIKSYEESLEILERLGSKAEMTRTLFNLALIYFDLGDNEKYLAFLNSFWKIIKNGSENKILLANYYSLKADEKSADNMYLDAHTFYEDSLKIFCELKNQYEILRVKYSIAENYLRAGNKEEALDLSCEVMEESTKFNYTDLLAKSRLLILLIKICGENEKIYEIRNSLLEMKNESYSRDNVEFRLALNHILSKTYELLGDLVLAKSYHDTENEILNKIMEHIPFQYRESFVIERKRRLPMAINFNSTLDLKEKTYSAKLEKLFLINTKLNSNLNLDSLLDIIIDTALSFSNAERGFLVLSENDSINVKVARNMEKKRVEDSISKISKKIISKVMESGAPIISNDVLGDNRFDEYTSVMNLKLKSIFCIPFKIKERTIGAIYLDNTLQRGVFNDLDKKLIQTFADQAAVAIENARLFTELERSKKEIEEFNAKLEKKVISQAEELEIKEELLHHSKRIELKYDYKKIIGKSRAMMEVFTLLDKVMDSELPILIRGESGTGKELIARALHFNGLRKDKSFLTENCAALSETLLESELFGHKRGSFTGAIADKKGLFELANMGTIFLDEIGDMSINMQKKLLRVLQNGEVRRIGDDKIVTVDVRLISATNKDIVELVKDGRFREDLMYRINVIRIDLPSLSDRKEDIPFMIEHFIEKFCRNKEIPIIKIDKSIIEAFMNYNWPGNVRELENEIHRLITLSDKKILQFDLIEDDIRFSKKQMDSAATLSASNGMDLEAIECNIIEKTLKDCWWNKKRAAEVLKISRPTLDAKIKKFKISKE